MEAAVKKNTLIDSLNENKLILQKKIDLFLKQKNENESVHRKFFEELNNKKPDFFKLQETQQKKEFNLYATTKSEDGYYNNVLCDVITVNYFELNITVDRTKLPINFGGLEIIVEEDIKNTRRGWTSKNEGYKISAIINWEKTQKYKTVRKIIDSIEDRIDYIIRQNNERERKGRLNKQFFSMVHNKYVNPFHYEVKCNIGDSIAEIRLVKNNIKLVVTYETLLNDEIRLYVKSVDLPRKLSLDKTLEYLDLI